MNITTLIISLIAVLSVILLFYVFKESTKRQDEINRLTSEKAASVASQEQLNAQLEQKKTEIADMQQKLERNNRDIADTLAEKARLEEQIRMINEKQKELEEKTKLEFQNLSNSILKEQTEIFKQNNEKGLNEILNPVKDKLDSFKKAMTDYNNTQISYASALNQQIKDLSQVNSSIGKEAQELTNALRNNGKVQGDWGEHVLKRILDISGLKEGLHYTTQETRQSDGTVIRNDNGGMLRPDVILFMPDGKRLIVDSKVSLTAYTEYINADDDKERAEALRRHVVSVRKHIDELDDKDYARHVDNAYDTVFLFIPNEPAYLIAMENDHDMWEYAYKKKIVIVSPTHLISVMQLQAQLWSRENQAKNAVKIGDEVNKLMAKLANFVKDLEKVQSGLSTAQKAYDDAYKKLKTGNGNILSKGAKIQQLAGLEPDKAIEESTEENGEDDKE